MAGHLMMTPQLQLVGREGAREVDEGRGGWCEKLKLLLRLRCVRFYAKYPA